MPGRLRRLTVYETTDRFYLVGSDASGTKYNVLKIDRINSKVLMTGEPEVDYSKADIMELLSTINSGNSIVCKSSANGGKKGRTNGGLLERVFSAYGVLGVIRFLEGYYLLIVTKANVIASFGYHSIYKIAEVAMISIGSDDHTPSADEQRYVKQFQSVDLSTDFYFSYTYDLSRTLQENALNTKWDKGGERKSEGDSRFIWNKFLLDPLRSNLVSERWYVEIVHGFVRQQVIDLPCSKLSLVLIGRRSSNYAGTRYLKRGANLHGDVANDVETEQMVWDMHSSPCILKGRFSSFVQRRGSVPLRWTQDPSTRGVVGKPLILIGIHEPHAITPAAHFRDLKKKYGDPIVVMNLVKKREKRRGDENILHEQFVKSVRYLNQFLTVSHRILYLSFDVARCHKSATQSSNVLTKLEELGKSIVCKSGWFQSSFLICLHALDTVFLSNMNSYNRRIFFIVPKLITSFPLPHRLSSSSNPLHSVSPSLSPCGRFLIQKGVCRTNCVDCLDRTNVAQFGIGKVAMAYQLCALGVLQEPIIELSSEVSRVLEELFDEHGDTMAWQYAGSQLVHSVKHYKKMGALQEKSRDVIQTLSRYYSNTFSDYDKQAALNLFLGVYRPQITIAVPLWDLLTDIYLHFPPNERIRSDYCLWWKDEVEDDTVILSTPSKTNTTTTTLPYRSPSRDAFGSVIISTDDNFREYYRTFEMTSLDLRLKQMSGEGKTIVVNGVNEQPNTGQFMKLFKSDPKTIQNTKKRSELSDDEDDEGEDKSNANIVEMEDSFDDSSPQLSFPSSNIFPYLSLDHGLSSPSLSYGISLRSSPCAASMALYEKYAEMSMMEVDYEMMKGSGVLDDFKQRVRQPPKRTLYTADSACHTEIPEVSDRARSFYTTLSTISSTLSANDRRVFEEYTKR